MINRKRQIALIIFFILITTVFACENIRQSNIEFIAPANLQEQVERMIKANPRVEERDMGWCGTARVEQKPLFEDVFRSARTEHIIPFLEHEVSGVTWAAHRELKKRGWKAKPAIKRAYKTGSARIQLTLLKDVNPDASPEDVLRLLNEIIENENLKIYYRDLNLHAIASSSYQYENQEKYPIDINKFYLKLMESDYVPDKVVAVKKLGQMAENAKPAVSTLIEILDGKNYNLEDYGYSMGYDTRQSFHNVVITALGNIGPAASDAIPIIESRLGTSDYKEYINIRTSLYQIGKDKDEHLSFILSEFDKQLPENKMEILLLSMRCFGPEASAALLKLKEMAKTNDKQFRNPVKWAIDCIEGPVEKDRIRY